MCMYTLPCLYRTSLLFLSFQESMQHANHRCPGDKYMAGKVMYNKISIDQLGLIKTYVSHTHVVACTIVSPLCPLCRSLQTFHGWRQPMRMLGRFRTY